MDKILGNIKEDLCDPLLMYETSARARRLELEFDGLFQFFCHHALDSRSAELLQPAQLLQQPVHAVGENSIHQEEVNPEDEHSHNDHRGGCLDFLARRRHHLAHLGPHVIKEATEVTP